MVGLVVATPALAEVRVFVEADNGEALIKYECTEGEVVRAFPLDVTVDQGRIIGISDFFRGESTAVGQGYGIFPAAFRDHLSIGPGTNINWLASGYTPLAVASDDPGDTLPGLGSGGVTLEFGAVWDPALPAAAPGPMGTLCTLQISEGATVSVAGNQSRGGVLSVDPDLALATVFSAAFVQPPEILSVSATNGTVAVSFLGGELETAPGAEGPWTATGDVSGEHNDLLGGAPRKFYRVRSP